MKLRIKLASPIEINSVTTDTLVMREPTVGDQLDLDKLAKNEAERELVMFARLTDCAPDDLKKLTLRDLDRVQKAYLRLVADDGVAIDTVVEVVA